MSGGETAKKGKGNLGTASTAERKLLPKGVGKLEKTSSQENKYRSKPILRHGKRKPKGKRVYKHPSTQQETEKGEGAPRRFGGTQPVNGSDLTGTEKGETAARLPLVRRTPNRATT